ncbi:AAA ATPase [Candidozyma auris]|uniref:Cell division control protein n=2 Tax=Candidozyma auris TaxID=498019 RepID=A0A8F2VX73_CANAR|nr:hypothetical protein QG37_00133 [[Candida] auris]PIS54382.1 hypothetical protein CJI97_004085 [[Candida] auris]QWW21335.1 hypothetical protein CA7LBN_000081 [[Candida] auris]
MPNMKRSAQHSETSSKRRALQPVSANQLATPPTTPEKKSVIDLGSQLSKQGVRKLDFSDSVYAKAKGVFQRGARDETRDCLVGREEEAHKFTSFLKTSIVENKCNSLYISGPPGTGKTAQVNLSLDRLTGGSQKHVYDLYSRKVQVMRVNCMTVGRAENVFHEIYCHVTGQNHGRRKTFDDVYEYLTSGCNVDSLVVMLDEMDYLITKDQQVLFQLFQCASTLKSSVFSTKLVLVGISNALDLTDKFLPRLRSNGYTPESLQFLPYTGEQVRQVIISKLRSLVDKENADSMSEIPIMHPVAIQLCCKKCAAVTGDLRKAFDICYKSIELVERQTKQQTAVDKLTFANAPKVLINHVAQVCAATFGDTSQSKIKSLNLLQKAVLCCLFNHDRSSSSTLTVNKLFDFYTKHTAQVADMMLGTLRKGEFLEIISAMEASSVIVLASTSRTCTGLVDVGSKSVRPNVSYDDISRAIQDVGVLRRLFNHSSI